MSVIYLKPAQPANSTPHTNSDRPCNECVLDVHIHIDPVGMVIMTCDLRHRAEGEVSAPTMTGDGHDAWFTLNRMANTQWMGAFNELSQWVNFMAEDLCSAAFSASLIGIDLIDFPVPVVTALLEVLDEGPSDAVNAQAYAELCEAEPLRPTRPIEVDLPSVSRR